MLIRHLRGRCALGAAAMMLSISGLAACNVESGPRTAALVELYTSEGCSSCPPADRLLNSLSRQYGAASQVVPVSLHVDYWDYIGWKDPYARPAFAQRHRWLARINRSAAVYTPHFFVNGVEVGWRPQGLAERIHRVNAMPAAASIRIGARSSAIGRVDVDVEARATGGRAAASLYVALTQSGLASQVTAGENRGVRLEHDHVARAWIGPLRLRDGHARLQQGIALPQSGSPGRFAVVAFVQDDASGAVLQAISTGECLPQ